MDVMKALNQMPNESVNCVVTSPPYWALRDYGIEVETVWDNNVCLCRHDIIEHSNPNPYETSCCIDGCNCKEFEECEHEWNSFMRKGQHGGNKSEKVKIKGVDGFQCFDDVKESFCVKCNAWKGQLGLEPTFDLYIKHLCDIFDNVKRVLRKDGTCFVNIGDTYSGAGSGQKDTGKAVYESGDFRPNPTKTRLPDKSLCMIPFRFAIEMVNRGWILRNTIIWYKRNCMPSSAKDRFTVDFEYVFFFVKSKRYWFEQQYEPHEQIDRRTKQGLMRVEYNGKSDNKDEGDGVGTWLGQNPLGRNRRCVWDITTEPFKEAHFAVFPEGLVEPMIKSGCPEFVCTKCGKPREKIMERNENPKDAPTDYTKGFDKGFKVKEGHGFDGIGGGHKRQKWLNEHPKELVEFTKCSCNAPFTGGIVLDPFVGSGTSMKVARDLNRNCMGIDINPKYAEIILKRLGMNNHQLVKTFEVIK